MFQKNKISTKIKKTFYKNFAKGAVLKEFYWLHWSSEVESDLEVCEIYPNWFLYMYFFLITFKNFNFYEFLSCYEVNYLCNYLNEKKKASEYETSQNHVLVCYKKSIWKSLQKLISILILYFNEIHIVQKKNHRLWVSVLLVFVFSKQNPTYYAYPKYGIQNVFFRNLMLGEGSLFQRSVQPKSRRAITDAFSARRTYRSQSPISTKIKKTFHKKIAKGAVLKQVYWLHWISEIKSDLEVCKIIQNGFLGTLFRS